MTFPDLPEPIKVITGGEVAVMPREEGVYDIALQKGREIVLSGGRLEPTPPTAVQPTASTPTTATTIRT